MCLVYRLRGEGLSNAQLKDHWNNLPVATYVDDAVMAAMPWPTDSNDAVGMAAPCPAAPVASMMESEEPEAEYLVNSMMVILEGVMSSSQLAPTWTSLPEIPRQCCQRVARHLTTDSPVLDAEQMIASVRTVAEELPCHWMRRWTSLPEIPRQSCRLQTRHQNLRACRDRRTGLNPEVGLQRLDTVIDLDAVIFLMMMMMMEWHERAFILSASTCDTPR